MSRRYQPLTRNTKQAWEEFLANIQPLLDDEQQQALRECSEDVLECLLDIETRDIDKKEVVEGLLDIKLSEEYFRNLLVISKRITDFEPKDAIVDETMDITDGQIISVEFSNDAPSTALPTGQSTTVVDDNISESDSEEGNQIQANQEDTSELLSADHIDAKQVDAHWIQREMGPLSSDDDAFTTQNQANSVFDILASDDKTDDDVETALLELFEYEKMDFIKKCLTNRWKIVWCTKLERSKGHEETTAQLREELLQQPYGESIILELSSELKRTDAEADAFRAQLRENKKTKKNAADKTKTMLDIKELSFENEGHTMSNKQCRIPNAKRFSYKGYDEVHVPPSVPQKISEDDLISISKLPKWCQPAFEGMKRLNPIQSKCCTHALTSSKNMLLCAPTGAGKTNVAVLSILQAFSESVEYDEDPGGVIDPDVLSDIKVVYVAPMKALVQEVVLNLGNRLSAFKVKVSELTGDTNMTKSEIRNSQVIVTTPEKWDIVTRKAGEKTHLEGVKLIIFDEIHLLHDSRGPVIEAIIARMLRSNPDSIRLVGLSATLPNYEDVATTMSVPKEGLLHFDNSYRPIPLEQQYIGIMEKKPMKRRAVMNDIVYKKVMEDASKQHQVMVFTHSRKDTASTAKMLKDRALDNGELSNILKDDSSTRDILEQIARDTIKDPQLKEIIPFGFGIHHAGLCRSDRSAVEKLFDKRHLRVLVSTATLAWGVNLPAHTVIIKGTQIYNPEKGKWTELSSLDVMQMIGRGGRPQYDKKGVGIIITGHTELPFYLSLLNQQLPIESQFITKLVDQLNAEVVMGNVLTVEEGVDWLRYTYLYARMRKNPQLYGITLDDKEDDPELTQRRTDLIHTAASMLDKASLLKYDRRTGNFESTDLGRVASHYYLTSGTIQQFNEGLKPTMHDLDVFRLFSMADEFKYISVREEEKAELQKLLDRVPIPVKEGVDNPLAKVNVLLQTYISSLKLDGFALMADMIYVTQSAGRVLRAMFETVKKRGWAQLTDILLTICIQVERRVWSSHSPLRQFGGDVPLQIIQSLERKNFSWERYNDLGLEDVSKLINNRELGKKIFHCIHMIPRLDLKADIKPLTRSLVRVSLSITADFKFHPKYHGVAETFLIMVSDPDGEQLLHVEPFVLARDHVNEEHVVYFYLPILEPMPPQYFIKAVSERWLWSETTLPVSFRKLILPDKAYPCTELKDLRPIEIASSSIPKKYHFFFNSHDVDTLNSIQTQCYPVLMGSNDSCLLCTPGGSGKTICAELALIKFLMNTENSTTRERAAYVAPTIALAKNAFERWIPIFEKNTGRKMVFLTGDTVTDLKLLESGDVIVAAAEHWDQLSRRWARRKNIATISLFIADDLHMLRNRLGAVMEVVISRMRYMSSRLQKTTPLRIVGLSYPVLYARDIGDWIGIKRDGESRLLNFHPTSRPVPLTIQLKGFDQAGFSSRMIAMRRPVYLSITQHSEGKPVIIYTPSQRTAYDLVADLIAMVMSDTSNKKRFLGNITSSDLEKYRTQTTGGINSLLSRSLSHGIGFLKDGMTDVDLKIVKSLFSSSIGAIKVLVVPHPILYKVKNIPTAHTVILCGTQFYNGSERRHEDYPIADLFEMIGHCGRQNYDDSSTAIVMCHSPQKSSLMKILHEPFPVESALDECVHDHFNAEITAGSIESMHDAVDYLTWSYLYRRLPKNPNYYGMFGKSHEHTSGHLSELAENAVESLEAAGCITSENGKVEAANLGMVSAYYYTSFLTIEMFNDSLSDASSGTVRNILKILSSADELFDISIRHHESDQLRKLFKHIPMRGEDIQSFHDPHSKVLILLNYHLCRQTHRLTPEHLQDLKAILPIITPLVSALVDVVGSKRWLRPLLASMDVSQMLVQGMWSEDSPLLQIPHFTPEIVKKCESSGVSSIFDIDEEILKQVGIPKNQHLAVSKFCNAYPDIEIDKVTVSEADDLHSGSPVSVAVSIKRDLSDDSQTGGGVMSQTYPVRKEECWWVVIGDEKSGHVLSLKKATILKHSTVRLEFVAPSQGVHQLKMFLICDSYLGCDLEENFSITVGEAEDSDEETEESDDN